MWPSKPHMNMLEHRIDALLREGPHDASREEIAHVLVALAVRTLKSFDSEAASAAGQCHALVDRTISEERGCAQSLAASKAIATNALVGASTVSFNPD